MPVVSGTCYKCNREIKVYPYKKFICNCGAKYFSHNKRTDNKYIVVKYNSYVAFRIFICKLFKAIDKTDLSNLNYFISGIFVGIIIYYVYYFLG